MKKSMFRRFQRWLFDWSTGLCLRLNLSRLCTKIFDLCPRIEQEIDEETNEMMRKAELTMKINNEDKEQMLKEILRRCHEIDEQRNSSK